MSDRQSPGPDDEQDQLPEDPQDRAELEWLLAREDGSQAPAPSDEIVRGHAQLAEMLDTLPVGAPNRSWHADVLRLIDEAERTSADGETTAPAVPQASGSTGADASKVDVVAVAEARELPPVTPLSRRTTVRISAIGAALFAAAAAVVLFMKVPTRSQSQDGGSLATQDTSSIDARVPALELRVGERIASRGGGDEDGGVIAVNQPATITLPTPIEGPGELRVFRRGQTGGAFLAYMCGSTAAPCQLGFENKGQIDITVTSVGEYVAVVIRGESGLSLEASFDEFRRASKQSKAILMNFRAR